MSQTTEARYQRHEGRDSQIVVLRSKYPCCGRRAFFRAVVDVSRELYERRCSCGARWMIARTTLKQGGHGRIDKLEWDAK